MKFLRTLAITLLVAAALSAAAPQALAKKKVVDIYDLSLDENLELPEINSDKQADNVRNYQDKIAIELKKQNYDVETMREREVIVVTLPASVLFDANDTTLTTLGANRLRPLMNLLNNPCIQVNEEQHMVLRQYYRLVTSLMELDLPKRKDAIRSLGSSLFYFFVAMWSKNIDNVKVESAGRNSARANIVMENFLKLVGEHHHEERQVGFYAEKLYLTPKYLSKLVRSVSGRSAPEWINSFVILEAKNLLKYSNLSIKEIVYNLHFSSVPSFYKFFRKQTGMTPMEYRES